MHRGEDTSGEDASGKDTCGEDTSGKVEHSSSYDEHSGDQGGPASGSKLIRVVEEMGTHATDVAGKRHSDGCSQCQRILHQTKRPAVGVVGAYVALTKSLKDQCPPALNGEARDTGSSAL